MPRAGPPAWPGTAWTRGFAWGWRPPKEAVTRVKPQGDLCRPQQGRAGGDWGWAKLTGGLGVEGRPERVPGAVCRSGAVPCIRGRGASRQLHLLMGLGLGHPQHRASPCTRSPWAMSPLRGANVMPVDRPSQEGLLYAVLGRHGRGSETGAAEQIRVQHPAPCTGPVDGAQAGGCWPRPQGISGC